MGSCRRQKWIPLNSPDDVIMYEYFSTLSDKCTNKCCSVWWSLKVPYNCPHILESKIVSLLEHSLFFENIHCKPKHPYTTRTLANGQSVREDYGRFGEWRVAYGRFCSLYKLKLYLSRYILSRKNDPSLQLAVDKFMTECFMNHESCAIRLHVGPSFEDHARVDFYWSIQQNAVWLKLCPPTYPNT